MRLTMILAVACFGLSTAAWADGNSDASGCAAATDFDTAIALCNRALESSDLSEEDRANTLYNRGRSYNGKGDNDRAILYYDAAIRLKPAFAVAFHNRGVSYDAKRDYDRAIQDYNEAVRL